jgi:hypothetical protein
VPARLAATRSRLAAARQASQRSLSLRFASSMIAPQSRHKIGRACFRFSHSRRERALARARRQALQNRRLDLGASTKAIPQRWHFIVARTALRQPSCLS